MHHTHVWLEEPRSAAGRQVLTTRIEPGNAEPVRIWFSVPEEGGALVTSRADPALVISLFTAMKAGHPVTVHGEVAPSLIRNLEEFQAAWSSWFPGRYQLVEIRADRERELPPGGEGAVCAFSGGVDAAFTAYRHQHGDCGRRSRRIQRAVMIQGYDFPAGDAERFAPALESARRMTTSQGIELLHVNTNYREVEPVWEDVHLACVSASLMLFQEHHSVALVGSSEPYRALVIPWASNPVTDHLLAHDGFRLIHDGAECTRMQKLQALTRWREAMEDLLVCWEPAPDGRNCCRCKKCIRTILNFRTLGLPRPACFDRDVEDRHIAGMTLLNDTMINDFEVILGSARDVGLREAWVETLQRIVAKYRFRKAVGTWPLVKHSKAAMLRFPLGQRAVEMVRWK